MTKLKLACVALVALLSYNAGQTMGTTQGMKKLDRCVMQAKRGYYYCADKYNLN